MIKLIKSTFFNEKEVKKKLQKFIQKADILSMNEQCFKFEKSFAKKQKRKYAIYVSNGSAANLILIQTLLNLGVLNKGDKVGFSSLTWPTNVMPLIQLGLKPVAVDCNLETLNVGPSELNKQVKGMKMFFLTNVLGFCDDIEKIKDICERNKIILIEDNCESLGSMVGDKLLGNFGLASTFSFYVGHHLSTIEGGMVCTDDEMVKDMLIATRAHGWDRNLGSAKQQELRSFHKIDDFYAKYTFYDLAYNVRPTEIGGFLGNVQLKYWNNIIQIRQQNFFKFKNIIDKNNDFLSLKIAHMNIVSNFAVPVICKNKKIKQKYIKRFVKNEVEIRPVIAGNMELQPFYKKYIKSNLYCSNSSFAHTNGFYFGNNPDLTEEEIKLLCDILKK